jgi:drug/metabolite transporter (DMT)-like permease
MNAPTADGDAGSSGAGRRAVWLTDVSLVVMAMIWGVNFSVVKYATNRVDPIAFNALRICLAAVCLMAIGFAVGKRWPPRRVILSLLVLGVLGNGIYQLFFVAGISNTRAGDAALVIAATPAFIALLGRMRGIERVSAKGWMGILLSIGGISLITFGTGAIGAADRSAALLGDLMILCGSIAWAVYTVLLKPYTDSVDGVQLSAITMVGGAVPFFVFALPHVQATEWTVVSGRVWGAMAFSGIGGLVIAYLIWYRGVRVIGPTRTAMYSNLQPLFGVVVAWWLLGELPTVHQLAGAASITSGLLLTRS